MSQKLENCWMILPDHKVGHGDIEIEGEIIKGVNLHCSPSPSTFTSPRLVMPGLINCHGHTAMTLVRGLGSGLPLQRWLEEAIFPVEAKMKPEDVHAGDVWGIREMLAGGTTCVADMYDFPWEMEKALYAHGMKGRVCRVGLNFIPGRLEDCIEFAQEVNQRGSGLQTARKRSASTGSDQEIASPLVAADLCVHSEYLTDEAFCRGLAEANKELKRPLHFHVSETEKEHNECIARHGKTPIAYLAGTGILDHGGYAAHCVWCTDDDFRIMAEKNVSLIHNPTSNMKLGSGFARIGRAMELGVNVALGTEGCASNDNLDMFEEMHLCSLIHKGLAKDPTVLPAWDVIDMATVNGAKALGMSDTGEIAVGKKADLCVVDLDKPHLTPCLDLPNLIVNSMHASDVVMTVVDGRVVYEKSKSEGVVVQRNCKDSIVGLPTTTRTEFLAAVKRIGLETLA